MKEYNEIINLIQNKYQKEEFERVYKQTQNLDETLLYMYHKFKEIDYLLKISSDDIKIEEANLLINDNGQNYAKIIASISSDERKVENLEKVKSR